MCVCVFDLIWMSLMLLLRSNETRNKRPQRRIIEEIRTNSIMQWSRSAFRVIRDDSYGKVQLIRINSGGRRDGVKSWLKNG